ncbi:hypothetical protein [Longispora albida]|uniref:hypothetical protein n=1 Tax=Longispora albida TaxID=203523 RepID=UPI0012F7C584|nr:hypothetical protein [Longispora albida]
MSILGGAMENCDSAVYNFQAGGHSDAVQQALHIRGIIEEAAGMGNALIERTRDALNAAANLIG